MRIIVFERINDKLELKNIINRNKRWRLYMKLRENIRIEVFEFMS